MPCGEPFNGVDYLVLQKESDKLRSEISTLRTENEELKKEIVKVSQLALDAFENNHAIDWSIFEDKINKYNK